MSDVQLSEENSHCDVRHIGQVIVPKP